MGKTAILCRRQVTEASNRVGVQRQVQLRDSKQPGRSSALRSISNNTEERPIVGLSERVYESTKLAALFDVLVDQGCPAGEILRNVNLTVDEVHSPKSRISLAELMTACENAIRLSRDPHLPYRIGTSIHISAYGMYGFAILCCPDFRKAMAFAELYHALAAPLAQPSNSPNRRDSRAGSLSPMRAPQPIRKSTASSPRCRSAFTYR